jgi:hypothetical protein
MNKVFLNMAMSLDGFVAGLVEEAYRYAGGGAAAPDFG